MNHEEFEKMCPAMDAVLRAAYKERPWDYNSGEEFIMYGLSQDLKEAYNAEEREYEDNDEVMHFFEKNLNSIDWGS